MNKLNTVVECFSTELHMTGHGDFLAIVALLPEIGNIQALLHTLADQHVETNYQQISVSCNIAYVSMLKLVICNLHDQTVQ